jgi:aminoglycoside phosphotransferase (APT) family kinase protein
VTEPGPLLASGRDGDIYEYGPGLVLRRTKDGRNIEGEARVMAQVAEHGFPVPQVHDVRNRGTEIVMERLVGPMMMDEMTRRPSTMTRNARLLADLHEQLHRIEAPEWLRPVDATGDRVLHLDLHPMNVMMTERGPVVIDWTNAARGEPLTDVGVTYVILTCSRGPMSPIVHALLAPFRRGIARAFARRFRGPDFEEHVAFAADLKAMDPSAFPAEITSCRRLAARMRSH